MTDPRMALSKLVFPIIQGKLEIYETLLKKWQSKINLVSRETLKDIKQRHFLDSLQLIDYLPQDHKIKIADVGSGAGFPGMVLALTGIDVCCIDSDKRKTIFLSEVARATGTQTTIINARVEDITQKFDYIVARGFISLTSLLDLAKRLTTNGNGIFLKGKNYQQEIDEAMRFFSFKCEIHPSITNSQSAVIVATNISQKAHNSTIG